MNNSRTAATTRCDWRDMQNVPFLFGERARDMPPRLARTDADEGTQGRSGVGPLAFCQVRFASRLRLVRQVARHGRVSLVYAVDWAPDGRLVHQDYGARSPVATRVRELSSKHSKEGGTRENASESPG
jgi:hypothetical protein